jgi:DNA repair protein RecN (Recombination protein N)
MLIELRVRDYAVIEDLSLELRPGLSVFSGETGAGKSLVVGALSLLVGERASSQSVRKGSSKAVVEAAFDISRSGEVESRLADLGLAGEDGLLLLRREVAAEGRNRAWVNGSPATASTVGELGNLLIDIHGQHEHQSLLRPASQRNILDRFGGASAQVEIVRGLHAQIAGKETDFQEKTSRVQELETRADFLRFQLKEVDDARVEEGEEERLDEESRRLAHAEELAKGATALYDALYGGDHAISDQTASLRDHLRQLSNFDPSLGEVAKALEEAYHLLSDTGQKMGTYASGLEFDPNRLEEVQARQDLLFRIKRKYGTTLADVLARGHEIRGELSELDGASFDLEGLNGQLEALHASLRAEAETLTHLREEAAQRLQGEVQGLLPELGLGEGVFECRLVPLESPGPFGNESVNFHVSLNPGFDPGPLSGIASGGELSRIMLALTSILAGTDGIPSLIFDEIDAGIGGEVALKVADKLRAVAAHHQVFVVTHLPQLASRAHHQLLVEKLDVGGMASTRVRPLETHERVLEVARMLGGDAESSTSRDHARELLRES